MYVMMLAFTVLVLERFVIPVLRFHVTLCTPSAFCTGSSPTLLFPLVSMRSATLIGLTVNFVGQ